MSTLVPSREKMYKWSQQRPWDHVGNMLISNSQRIQFPTPEVALRWRRILNADVQFKNFYDSDSGYGHIDMFVNGKKIGYLTWNDRGTLEIDNLKILPNYRYQGWGSLLMGYFLDNVHETVQLDICDVDLIDFYNRFGFEVNKLVDSDNSDQDLNEMLQEVEETGAWLQLVRT